MATTSTKFELKLGMATREAFGKALVEPRQGKSRRGGVRRRSFEVHVYFAISTTNFRTASFNAALPSPTWWRSARGLAYAGKIPFVSSFSAFVMNKGFEQFRVMVAYPGLISRSSARTAAFRLAKTDRRR